MKNKTEKESKDSLSFEEALHRLESLVEQLENGDVPLAETLQAFEEGMKLVEQCHLQLDQAESKLKRLIRNKEGLLDTEDLDLEEENPS